MIPYRLEIDQDMGLLLMRIIRLARFNLGQRFDEVGRLFQLSVSAASSLVHLHNSNALSLTICASPLRIPTDEFLFKGHMGHLEKEERDIL